MGEVYLAEHVLLRRPCAIKLIRPERAGDANCSLRFEREVQATATLTHPNTVADLRLRPCRGRHLLLRMEYLPGLNLEELVRRHGPLPPERAVHFLRQVCGALREAHGVGLIHRDIKPSNIIACERGGVHDVAKLLDFGLVCCMAQAGARPTCPRTVPLPGPLRICPRNKRRQPSSDARSDIYGLGALAYFLLTGQPPFVRPTVLQMLIAHRCDPPVRCTSYVPMCRPTCKRSSCAAWKRILPGLSRRPESGHGVGELSCRRSVDRGTSGRLVARSDRFIQLGGSSGKMIDNQSLPQGGTRGTARLALWQAACRMHH